MLHHILRMCEIRLFRSELMTKYEIVVLACQVGPFHLKVTQINSEMNCIAKHKCPDESQKLDTRRRGENFNATSHVSRGTTYIFCILCLYIILCDTRKVSENLTFILEQSLILSSVCVIIVTRPIGDSITPRLGKVQ